MTGRVHFERSTALRTWQAEAVGTWEEAGQRGVASVVTGAGKTVFAEACMSRFLAATPHGRIVVIVPTLGLLDQWYVSLREDLGAESSTIATYSGEGIPKQHELFNLMVLNTARRWAPKVSRLAQTLLVVDECHRAASTENAKALEGWHAATLGLSATPERDYDDLFEEAVRPALGPIIYRYDYNRARADGVISPFTLVNVEAQLTATERAAYDKLTKRLAGLVRRYQRGEDVGLTIKQVLQQRAGISANAAMRVPLAVKLAEDHPRSRCLIFHERIAAAEELATLLRARGASVATYHSRLGADLRRDNLRMFRRGLFDILVSCRALDEGVNVPEATIAIVASATASSRQRIQRLGRVLRPAEGKGSAVVYTIFATEVERRRLAKEEVVMQGAEAVKWLRVY